MSPFLWGKSGMHLFSYFNLNNPRVMHSWRAEPLWMHPSQSKAGACLPVTNNQKACLSCYVQKDLWPSSNHHFLNSKECELIFFLFWTSWPLEHWPLDDLIIFNSYRCHKWRDWVDANGKTKLEENLLKSNSVVLLVGWSIFIDI